MMLISFSAAIAGCAGEARTNKGTNQTDDDGTSDDETTTDAATKPKPTMADAAAPTAGTDSGAPTGKMDTGTGTGGDSGGGGGDTGSGMMTAGKATPPGVGPYSACVIDDQGVVACFGRCGPMGNGGSRAEAPAGLKATMVAVGRLFACALLASAKDGSNIRCWGGGVGTATVPMVSDAVEIAAGDAHACVRSAGGAVTCWGGATENQTPAGLVAKALAAGGAVTCAIADDDGVRCWGVHAATPPADLKARRIAVSGQPANPAGGKRYGCAVTTTDAVRCWGDDVGGVQTVPAGLKAKDVAAGDSAACALDGDGAVTCWGTLPRFGKKTPAALKARALAMKFRTVGAVASDGSFAFWGDVSDNRGMPPAGVKAAP